MGRIPTACFSLPPFVPAISQPLQGSCMAGYPYHAPLGHLAARFHACESCIPFFIKECTCVYVCVAISQRAKPLFETKSQGAPSTSRFPLVDDANLGNKKIPTQKKIELGYVLGILELLLEFLYDLMPNFSIKNSATSYCCL